MEDDNDKVRRNLVAMSTATILVAWLDVPVQTVLQHAVAKDWTPNFLKGWVAAYIVLFYLTMRFRFEQEGDNALKLAREIYSRMLNELILKEVTHDMALSSRTWWKTARFLVETAFRSYLGKSGIELRPSEDIDTLSEDQIDERRERIVWMHSDWGSDSIQIEPKSIRFRHTPVAIHTRRFGRGRVELTSETVNTDPSQKRTFYSNFYLSPFRALRIHLLAYLFSWIYSRASLVNLLPFILGLVASGVISFKITAHLLIT